MNGTKVLISGASIAGPALAFWLLRHGAEVTVVERAPALRDGGHGVDFRGHQLELLNRMGLTDEVRARQTGMGEQVIVDGTGARLLALPAAIFGGDLEIQRGDLSRILFEHTERATYLFGDSITAIRQDDDGVDVTFERSTPRRFDLVVGADGLHSAVRRAAFGPEAEFASYLGHFTAGFSMANTFGLDHTGIVYNEPGRVVMVAGHRDPARASVNVIMARPDAGYDRHERAAVARLVTEGFAGAGWELPQILAALGTADDLYGGPISQIELEPWSRGRVVLLGDAAWAAGPGGSGTGNAMTGAFVLASELAAAKGDHRAAFARYEATMRKAATAGQKQARQGITFLAPATAGKLRRRNRTWKVMSSRLFRPLMEKLASGAGDAVSLEAYPHPERTAA